MPRVPPGRAGRHAARPPTAVALAGPVRLEAEQTTAQVAGEEVVVHGNSRHGSPRSPSRGAATDAERIVGLLEPAVAALGLDLETVRITSAGRRRLLRIVVDAAMGEQPYTLEVTSPGVDRPLTEPKHWRRAVGRLVSAPVTARPPSATDADPGSLTVTGRVTEADARGVRLDVDGESREYGYSEIGAGRIQIEFARFDDGDRADEEGHDGH
jgi:ribosome maturation factor RimP